MASRIITAGLLLLCLSACARAQTCYVANQQANVSNVAYGSHAYVCRCIPIRRSPRRSSAFHFPTLQIRSQASICSGAKGSVNQGDIVSQSGACALQASHLD